VGGVISRQVLAEATTPKVSLVAEARDDEESGLVLDLSSCLNSCSKRGECVMGKCVCAAGRGGADCSEELASAYEEDDLDKLDMLEIVPDESMASLWD